MQKVYGVEEKKRKGTLSRQQREGSSCREQGIHQAGGKEDETGKETIIMDKKTLRDYEQACAVIRESERELEELKAAGKDEVREVVRGSEGFPYTQRTIHITEPTPEAKRRKRILKWQVAKANEIKAEVEREMKNAPLRIQRIIQFKYFEGETWDGTAIRMGGNATAESVRKELERYLK